MASKGEERRSGGHVSSRHDELFERTCRTLDHYAARMDRHDEALEKHNEALDRHNEALARHMASLERRDEAFQQQMAAFGRRSDALVDSTIGLRHTAEKWDRTADSLVGAISDLAAEVRGLKDSQRRK
jgi:chromosome segregation ATPase